MPQVSVDVVDEFEDIDDPPGEESEGKTVAHAGTLNVRMPDGRILGPFAPDDVQELVLQGRLTGNEVASYDRQQWLPLTSFPGLSNLAPARGQAGGPLSSPPAAQGGDFDFSFTDAPRTNASAEADDFDFSFSDLPAKDARGLVPPPSSPPAPASAGRAPAPAQRPGASMQDIFDDLPDDLPAPKGSVAGSFGDVVDLPAPKGPGDTSAGRAGGIDLPGLKGGVDLPGLKGGIDLPGLKGGIDLPGLKGGVDLPGLRGGIDLPGLKGESGLPGLKGETALPGLKGEQALPGLKGETALPGQRGASALPGQRGETALPGTRPEAGLPGIRGESGLPGMPELGGLVAPVGGDLPNLPGDAEARRFAETGLAEELEGGGPALATAPPGSKRKLILVSGLVAGLALVGGVTALIDGVGPFGIDLILGTEPTAPTPRSAPGAASMNLPGTPSAAQAGQPTASGPGATVVLPASEATLAEVAGYRAAIGAREQKGEGVGAESIDLIELYAFGALEFPGNSEWARRANELAGKLDDATKATLPGKVARLVAGLANSDGASLNEAIELSKANPSDARAAYLAGHAFVLKSDLDGAFAAFDKARTLSPDLLPPARLAGELAIKRGEMETARTILEGVYAKAAGTPSVANSLAAIEVHAGQAEPAQKLIDQVLGLPAERVGPAGRSTALTLRARLELGRGQDDAGLKTLEDAIKLYPQNLDAVELLSEHQFAAKAYDKALTQFEALRANGVSTPEIVIRIARCHEALNNAEKAHSELVAGIAQFPKSAVLQAELGDTEMHRRHYAEARAAYDKALEIDSKFEIAYLRISDLLIDQSKVPEAADFLAKALEARPSSAMIHFGAGHLKQLLSVISHDEALLGQAEREFREALRLDPTLLDARHQLAQTLLDKGDAAGAMKELSGLQARPDYHADLAYDLGRAQQALGKTDDAIRSYEDALTRHKDEPLTLLAAGTAYFEKKDYDKATERLTLAAQVGNKLTAAHYFLGRVALDQKKYALAQQKFQMASDEEAQNFEYRYWLGRSLLEGGQAKQAYQEFSAVSEGIKNDAKAASKLCDAHYQRGLLRFNGVADGTRDWRGAQGDFKSALDCDDKRAEIWTAYGDTFEVAQKDTAIQHYSKAIAVDRAYAPAYLKRGALYQNLEKIPLAKSDFESALRYDPKLAEPHIGLCEIMQGQGSRAAAKEHCEAYLKLAPTGESAGTAKDILDDLRRGP